ncbi:ribosome maturation factor RimM [Vicingaceae bacterium]|nr:ribosome maturation factor RimM [Vicingaceae bacterium]
MKIDDCFYLGYISKTIGTKGELAFKLDVDSPSSYNGLKAVFAQISPRDKQLVPFFLEKAEIQNNDLLRCKFEGVDDSSTAKSLVGTSLYLLQENLPELKEDQFYFHEIIGYTVIDKERGKLGKVEKVLEYSTSNLFSVPVGDKEVLIPISDETITKVDKFTKEIHVICPEGLIDLYLEG